MGFGGRIRSKSLLGRAYQCALNLWTRLEVILNDGQYFKKSSCSLLWAGFTLDI